MHSRTNLFGLNLPTYGCIAFLGTIAVFLVGLVIVLYRKLDVHDYIKLVLWSGISAIVGAKFWYLIVNTVSVMGIRSFLMNVIHHTGSWSVIANQFKKSGLSFYGGLSLVLVTVLVIAAYVKILRIFTGSGL